MTHLKNNILLLTITSFFLTVSCSKTVEYILYSGSNNLLIGKWIEKESEEIIQFAGTNHIFEFSQDSFFLERTYWTDALSPDNPCVNGHTVYFKGTYQFENNQIIFDGQSTNDKFILSPPECDRETTYTEGFEFEQESVSVLIFNPKKEVYFQIRLEKEG